MTESDPNSIVQLPPPAAPELDETPGHSDIFTRLSAHNEADLIGLVAYGIYQRQKREWIAAFREQFGRFPCQAERDAYAFRYREGAIDALRRDAEGTLAAFAEQVITDRSDELRASALEGAVEDKLGEIFTHLQSMDSFWHHIKSHAIGLFGLAALIGAGTLILNFEPTVEGIVHFLKWTLSLITHSPTPTSH